MTYPKSLNDAHSNILRANNSNEPLLILEDDVQWSGLLHLKDIPDDADAVYLGNSKYGLFHWASFEAYSKSVSRVISMQGTHAILYLSSRYKQAVAEAIDSSEKVLDVTISNLQKHFRVYTYNSPLFFQANENKKYTNLTVREILDSKRMYYVQRITIAFLACFLVFLALRKFR